MELPFDCGHSRDHLLSDMAAGLQGSEILRIAAQIRELKAKGHDVLDLTVGDFSPAQFRIPVSLQERLLTAVTSGETHYPPPIGLPALREAVVRLYRRDLGLHYPLSSVMVAGGTRPLIYATYRAVVDPKDVVVYPVPSWNNQHYCHLLGCRGVAIPGTPESRFLPDVGMLRPHVREARLIALCSPLNPSGTTFTPDTLEEIVDMVLEENARRGQQERPLYLLYDQVYWMLTFGAVRHVNPVMLRPEAAPFTILVDGISKAFAATGLRVGFGAAPPSLVGVMVDILSHVGAWAPRAEQSATAGFLDDAAAVEAHRREFRRALQARLEAVHEGFQRLASAGLPVHSIEPMGAIYLTVQVDVLGRRTPDGRCLDSNEGIRNYLLEAAGMGFVPFQSFAYPGDTGWFRASVGAVGLEDIRRGMPRLESALRALR